MNHIDKSQVIFDVTREDHQYKGVLFAEVDFEKMDKETDCPFPTPKNYIAGVMAIIWVDENGIWNAKMRVKFPSGNKQVVTKFYDKEHKEGISVNETYVLNDLYQLPMVRKNWLKNNDETPWGIVELIKNADMVESMTMMEKDG